jgi:hypothetical protein
MYPTFSIEVIMSFQRSPQMVIDLLTRKTVVKFAALQKALDGPSVQTVFRYLKKVPYRRCYNHRGMYYALHKLERYDQFGLWTWKGIHFSVDGSLKHTVKRMVHEADIGASHKELQARLHIRVHNTLLLLVENNEIGREELDGHFVYLHPDAKVRETQLAKRREIIDAVRFEIEEVADTVVIQILLVLIRYPGSRMGDVARRLKGHSPPITMRHVQVVFDRYGLDDVGKKKGPSKR